MTRLGVVVIDAPPRCRERVHERDASAVSAEANGSGRARLRFSARRRIPRAALGLKKNLRGTLRSRMADKEDTTPSLCHSGPSSVQHSVGDAIPQFPQRPDDGAHDPAVGGDAPTGALGLAHGRQEAKDVLADDPCGAELGHDPVHLPPQPATCSTHALATPGEGEVLTGEPSGHNVNSPDSIGIESLTGHLSHVGVDRSGRRSPTGACRARSGTTSRDGRRPGAAAFPAERRWPPVPPPPSRSGGATRP